MIQTNKGVKQGWTGLSGTKSSWEIEAQWDGRARDCEAAWRVLGCQVSFSSHLNKYLLCLLIQFSPHLNIYLLCIPIKKKKFIYCACKILNDVFEFDKVFYILGIVSGKLKCTFGEKGFKNIISFDFRLI